MSHLRIRGLTAAYDGVPVLHDVSLDVPHGTVLTLLGASGSGKTTLLRTIAGFLDPVTGSVHADGVPLVEADGRSLPPERRNLAMVFQHHAVWPHLSVADNVAYPLRRRRVARAERDARVRHALDVVELADLAGRSPDTLSGGQRQRVALARAIVAEPQALLLDEALSALDEPLRAALRLTLRRLVDTESLTMVQVTHDRDEALALADRIAVLDQGRIAQVGSPADLMESPATPAVARFLHDAAVVDGVLGSDGTFTAPGLTLPPRLLTHPTSATSSPGPARVALLPTHLEVAEAGQGEVDAVVETSLYGRSGTTTVVRWQGRQVRISGSHGDPGRVSPGTRIGVRVQSAALYPGA